MQLFDLENKNKYVCSAHDAEGVVALIPIFDNASTEYTVLPGFCDVHVHFREPGFSYKETIKSGSMSAAHGGYTAVCTMPNLNPAPDSAENLAVQQRIIEKDAAVNIYPYGTITKNRAGAEIAELEKMAPSVIAFSDDGSGVQDDGIMREAMQRARALGKIIAAHCEDNSLLNGGYIHDGAYAKAHGHKGISSASEYRQIERDLRLADETGCKYHVCHISTKESVEVIRQAKKSGVDVSCETGPHYLTLDDSFLQEDGRFKMNPPLRDKSDREALIEGVLDGTIDMIATDHAPHSAGEKSMGLENSAFGIVGLETAFPVLYTELVLKNVLTLEKLIELMSINPRKRFGIPLGEDCTVWDLNARYKIDPSQFHSLGRATPYEGKEVYSKCVAAVCGGRLAFSIK